MTAKNRPSAMLGVTVVANSSVASSVMFAFRTLTGQPACWPFFSLFLRTWPGRCRGSWP